MSGPREGRRRRAGAGSAFSLALRGVRYRSAASVATLLVAVVAVAAATLGPMYSVTAQDSLVRHRLARADTFQTGLLADTSGGYFGDGVPAQLADALAAVSDPRYDRFWGQPSVMAQLTGSEVKPVTDTPPGPPQNVSTVSWRSQMCRSVTMLQGRCPVDQPPAGRFEAMVSVRTATDLGLHVGDRVFLQLGASTPQANAPVLVGIYDQSSAGPPGWPYGSPAQQAPPRTPTGPMQQDEVLVDRATIAAATGDTRVSAFRPLRTPTVHARDLPALSSLAQPRTTASVTVASPAATLLADIAADRALVRSAATAVSVQVGLLGLFVLYLVVAAAAEERGPEVALAKLRGMRALQTAVFTLTEPVLLLILAAPVGLGVGVAADLLLASGLAPGSDIRLDRGVALAASAAVLGGVVAAVAAGRRLLRTPVLGQLRRTGGRRAALARSLALDVGALALAGAGIYELLTGSSDLVALAAPGLVALAVGLLAVRLVPPLARLVVTGTRSSRRVGAFLAARNTARRPAGSRLLVLLAVAVALAVFGTDGDLVARAVRSQTARAAVGAATVVHVDADSPGVLLDAVRAADPSGRAAMAAVASAGNRTTPLLAVDGARIAAVTSWDPRWAGTTAAALTAGLHPRGPAPLTVRGQFSATWSNTARGPAGDLSVTLDLRTPTGRRVSARLGRLAPRSSGQLHAPLPAPCDSAPCQLIGWDFTRSLDTGLSGATPTETTEQGLTITTYPDEGTSGVITLTGLADARGPLVVAAVAPTAAGGGSPTARSHWRYTRQVADLFDSSRPPDVRVSDSGRTGLIVTLDPSSIAAFTVEPAAIPGAVPALLGRDAVLTSFGDSGPTVAGPASGTAFGPVSAEDLAGAPVLLAPIPGRGVLPRIPTTGALVDLGTMQLERPRADATSDYQVWFAADSDVAALLSRLAGSGIRPVAADDPLQPVVTQTLNHQIAEMAATGPAVGLRLYIVAAVAAVLLALGALLTAGFVAGRRRSYEVAAVLALGAKRRTLIRAGLAEQLVLVVTGTVIGLGAGVVTARLALPVLGSITAGGPVAPQLVVWLPVLGLTATVLAVATAVGLLASRRIVGLARPERLREVQA